MPTRPRRSRRSFQRSSRLRAKYSSAFRTLPAVATPWPFRPRSAGFAAPTRNRSALHGSLHLGAGFPGWHPCQARESGAPVSAFPQEPPRNNTLRGGNSTALPDILDNSAMIQLSTLTQTTFRKSWKADGDTKMRFGAGKSWGPAPSSKCWLAFSCAFRSPLRDEGGGASLTGGRLRDAWGGAAHPAPGGRAAAPPLPRIDPCPSARRTARLRRTASQCRSLPGPWAPGEVRTSKCLFAWQKREDEFCPSHLQTKV